MDSSSLQGILEELEFALNEDDEDVDEDDDDIIDEGDNSEYTPNNWDILPETDEERVI